jgi:hypothetical protein
MHCTSSQSCSCAVAAILPSSSTVLRSLCKVRRSLLKISFSSLASASSLRSLDTSDSSSVIDLLPGPTKPPVRCFVIQFFKICGERLKRRPTSASVKPPSSTSFTASSLNSFVKNCRGIFSKGHLLCDGNFTTLYGVHFFHPISPAATHKRVDKKEAPGENRSFWVTA